MGPKYNKILLISISKATLVLLLQSVQSAVISPKFLYIQVSVEYIDFSSEVMGMIALPLRVMCLLTNIAEGLYLIAIIIVYCEIIFTFRLVTKVDDKNK